MITLSTRSRYGTRFLMSLARHRGENLVQIADIARDQGISAKYLEQIALVLKKAGIVETVRGRGAVIASPRTRRRSRSLRWFPSLKEDAASSGASASRAPVPGRPGALLG
ncbi:MAG: Rrf2 family transcriptional regulator [Desulfosoma sp.]